MSEVKLCPTIQAGYSIMARLAREVMGSMWTSTDRGQRWTKVREQRAESRGRRAEIGGRRAEIGEQRSDGQVHSTQYAVRSARGRVFIFLSYIFLSVHSSPRSEGSGVVLQDRKGRKSTPAPS